MLRSNKSNGQIYLELVSTSREVSQVFYETLW